MKRLTSILVFMAIIVGSCEKANLNEEKIFTSMAALKHNSYAILNSKTDPAGMPELTISKNGVVQEESLARLFCKETIFELIGGQTIPAGNVTVSNDMENLYVTYKSDFGWKIKEIHLYAGTFENIPLNNANVPVPGQFPIKESFNPAVEMVTYEIPLKSLPECPSILAHAVVGKDGQEETAWGKGELSFEKAFEISRWGWVINFCPEKCIGKDLVISSKSYVVNPEIYDPVKHNYEWWIVTKGPAPANNCLGIGFNTFNTNQVGKVVYDLIQQGDYNSKKGTMTVFTSIENNIRYLNVEILLDDKLSLSKSYLYVGSQDGLKKYWYAYNDKDCYKFYEWFFQKEGLSNTHVFKIVLDDINEK